MTLQDIYVMVSKAHGAGDPIPCQIVADMLEELGVLSCCLSDLRLKNVRIISVHHVPERDNSLWPYFSWTTDGKRGLRFKHIDFSLKAGNGWETLYLTLQQPLKDVE